MSSIQSVLFSQRFSAMIISGMFSVINCNILRQGVGLLVTYKVLLNSDSAFYWGSILGALYFLPSFIFSVLAGELADKMPKARLFQLTKALQIPICVLLVSNLFQENPNLYILGLSMFLMATHDAFFAPVRYAILPEYLAKDKLLVGNGILESSVLVSIAMGIGLASTISLQGGEWIYSTLLLSTAVAGYIASLWIPSKPASNKEPIKVEWNILKSIQENVDYVRENETIWQSVLGITWFWFVGYNFILQISNYVKFNLLCAADVSLAFNISYTLGIAAGSLCCHRLVQDRVDGRFTPLALAALGIFGLHMWAGSSAFGYNSQQLMPLSEFILTVSGWRLLLDVFALTFAGGVLIVPLYTIIQRLSRRESCSRNIAGLSIVSSLGMGMAAVLQTMIIASLGVKYINYMAGIYTTSVALAIYSLRIVPVDVLKKHGGRLIKWLFRIDISGLENFEKADKKLIVICNHISFLDVPVLALLLPRHVMFAINTQIAKWLVCRMVSPLTDTFPVDPTSPFAMKSLIKKVRSGRTCIIFPEGGLSRTGRIMKIYEGTSLIAEKTDADIIAININGADNTLLTPHRKNFANTVLLPKLRVSISSPFKLPKNDLHGKEKRSFYSQVIYQKLVEQAYVNTSKNHLIEEIYAAKDTYGANRTILEDITGKTLNYKQFIMKFSVLSLALAEHIPASSHIGLLLPNTMANLVTYFASIHRGYIPAMLNYTAGTKNLISAIQTAQIHTVITSRAFIEKAKLEEVVAALDPKVMQILYLEDIAKNITLGQKIHGAFVGLFWQYMKPKNLDPHSPALILFTSGSEGSPKGVVLSHFNIMANVKQLLSTIDIGITDRMFNALPMFHAFGFNIGTLTPVMGGVFTYLYPNPKHFAQIPNIVYEKDITVLIGTNTFLSAYHKSAHPYDFNRVRYVVAGGEKLTDETRIAYAENFGIRVIEGYGSTECAPVISCNTPIYNVNGSVGLALPGMSIQLTPFANRENAFELSVKGDNVMMGYLYASNPGMLHPPEDGWYKTGDVIEKDVNGFIKIVDRVKRFAKIGGEMVSLSQIENVVQSCWPEFDHGLVTVRDAKRGEKLILITTKPAVDRKELIKVFNEQGLSNLSLPAMIESMNELPLLGSGKIDYVKLKSLVSTLYEKSDVAEVL